MFGGICIYGGIKAFQNLMFKSNVFVGPILTSLGLNKEKISFKTPRISLGYPKLQNCS